VRSYTLDRWLAPPPALLTQKLTQAGGGGSHRLQVELQELEQVFDRPGNACVVVTLRATLRDADADRPLGERLVQLRQATSAGNAAGAVDAFALAIDKATALLCEWSRTFGPGA
jgi:cholesterol transport system auxiliary component